MSASGLQRVAVPLQLPGESPSLHSETTLPAHRSAFGVSRNHQRLALICVPGSRTFQRRRARISLSPTKPESRICFLQLKGNARGAICALTDTVWLLAGYSSGAGNRLWHRDLM